MNENVEDNDENDENNNDINEHTCTNWYEDMPHLQLTCE